jgi:predicted DNA-binding transcriptional regulator AlpA
MSELTRQQLCAALGVSESSIYRAEQDGLPYTPIGKRTKRYDLDECKRWFRGRLCQSGQTRQDVGTSASWSTGAAFTESCRRVHLRVMPSGRRRKSAPPLDGAA